MIGLLSLFEAALHPAELLLILTSSFLFILQTFVQVCSVCVTQELLFLPPPPPPSLLPLLIVIWVNVKPPTRHQGKQYLL